MASVFPLIGAISIVAIGWLRDQLANHLPSGAQASYDRASALLDQGNTDEAITELREAIRLAPEFAEAHHDLGYALGCAENGASQRWNIARRSSISPITLRAT